MAEPAMTPDNLAEAEPRELSREEFLQLLEARCQRQLGMSLDEFLAALDAGKLPDTPAVMRLVQVGRNRSGV